MRILNLFNKYSINLDDVVAIHLVMHTEATPVILRATSIKGDIYFKTSNIKMPIEITYSDIELFILSKEEKTRLYDISKRRREDKDSISIADDKFRKDVIKRVYDRMRATIIDIHAMHSDTYVESHANPKYGGPAAK